MIFKTLAVLISLSLTPSTIFAQVLLTESEKLHQIFDQDWEWNLKHNPFTATYVGDPRYADQVPDLSLSAIEEREEYQRKLLTHIETIDVGQLNDIDKINFELFKLNVSRGVEGQEYPDELLPMDQMGGIHSSLNHLATSSPKNSAKNIEDIISRIEKLPVMIDQTITLMKAGIDRDITPPNVTLAAVSHQIDAQITEDPGESPLFKALFTGVSNSISESRLSGLENEAKSIIASKIYPAMQKLKRYWETEYYPNTRKSIGLSALPNGQAWYNYKIKARTTTELDAEQIHELGLSEVHRIRTLMTEIMEQTGFEGELQEFFEYLRTDEQFFYESEEELLAGYRSIAKLIDPELPKLFGKLPRLPFGILPVPDYSAPSQPTAYYYPGSEQAGRAGFFYANTYYLKTRPKWEMQALTLHEAMPGHHLQLTLQQELTDLPRFRRFGGYTAFTEGWGLYAESLGMDLGMYQDPYSRFGQLTYEMWRAIRLVVDTGIHAKGWSRQQAIDFFMNNASKSEHDITVEIDRYIVWPGQALAYKIGELKFKELKAYAKEVLGEKFDIRSFHDQVLGSGSLPLPVLENNIKHWVENQLN
jgi:uncharacterized protein (DUF885 family)